VFRPSLEEKLCPPQGHALLEFTTILKLVAVPRRTHTFITYCTFTVNKLESFIFKSLDKLLPVNVSIWAICSTIPCELVIVCVLFTYDPVPMVHMGASIENIIEFNDVVGVVGIGVVGIGVVGIGVVSAGVDGIGVVSAGIVDVGIGVVGIGVVGIGVVGVVGVVSIGVVGVVSIGVVSIGVVGVVSIGVVGVVGVVGIGVVCKLLFDIIEIGIEIVESKSLLNGT